MANTGEVAAAKRDVVDGTLSPGQDSQLRAWSLWFIAGLSLSVVTFCSLGLLVMLLGSIGLNLYLAWQLSDLEITVSRRQIEPPAVVVATATAVPEEPASQPPAGPADAVPAEAPPAPSATPLPVATGAPDTGGPMAMATDAPGSAGPPPAPTEPPAPTQPPAAPTEAPDTAEPAPPAADVPRVTTSNNSYALIPLEGERDSRPADVHADLNLTLREPEPIPAELELIDEPGAAAPDPPRFSGILEPKFVATYAVHQWDLGCNCAGVLEEEVALVGIATTPGEPVYIPRRNQDIFQGKYYAVVLYATEDSLTFVYAREGTVANAYTVHYQGLQTDPNLLKLYRESQGNELPGLTLDTPVGIATDELIVAIRDRGQFMDVRSTKDWW